MFRLSMISVVGCGLALSRFMAGQQGVPIQLRVDLTDGPRHLVHATEVLPAHAGRNSFNYPQWIQGQHLPGGPIDNLTGLVFRAGGKGGAVLAWRRDLVDLYQFHVEAPKGTRAIFASYDVLEVPSRNNTIATNNHFSSHVAMLEPSDVVLYPSDTPVREIPVAATVHLPAGWRMATALRTEVGDGAGLQASDTIFKTVSMEQLVDSPLLAGDHCRQYAIAAEIRPVHTLDVCAEKEADLELKPAMLNAMHGLVRQASILFKSHHYEHYDFLVADSAQLGGDSIEHTQSADYVVKSLDLADTNTSRFVGELLPHEYVHSWCGKYRRPSGLNTPEWHTPMQDDLLWVYEGLTQYYGEVLAVRSGFRTGEQAVAGIDQDLYHLDQPGRMWRNVQDTADASSILRGNDTAYSGWRMSQDYYQEGALIWLEVDMKIRTMSGGKRSLDDFAAAFLGAKAHGGTGDTGPGVLAYGFGDVVRGLNAVQAYDWGGFWRERLDGLTAKPPTAGLEAAGYTYKDGETMVAEEAAFIEAAHLAELYHSLGVFVLPDGTLLDVFVGSPAFAAGLGPGDKVTLVNGVAYSADGIRKAVGEAKGTTTPIALTVVRNDETMVVNVAYHGGEKYAAVVRNGSPDVLMEGILRAR